MTENPTTKLYHELIAAGFNPAVAEALAENDISVEVAKLNSASENFSKFLKWNGILGYATMIEEALDNCRNMEGK